MLDHNKAKERMDICKRCPFNKLGICQQCGCIIRAKIYLKNTVCPIQKW